jgi:hypothetical protein
MGIVDGCEVVNCEVVRREVVNALGVKSLGVEYNLPTINTLKKWIKNFLLSRKLK